MDGDSIRQPILISQVSYYLSACPIHDTATKVELSVVIQVFNVNFV